MFPLALGLMQKIISYTFLFCFKIISTKENHFFFFFFIIFEVLMQLPKSKTHSQDVYFVKNKTLKSLKFAFSGI